jgi:cysteinyl-tRNA synthetase
MSIYAPYNLFNSSILKSFSYTKFRASKVSYTKPCAGLQSLRDFRGSQYSEIIEGDFQKTLIKFFNVYGRELQEFKPIIDNEVRMYTCGPTVWNYAHIGNFRTFLFEDLLRRYLEYRGYKVTQVMNLTDVDDRIIKICKEKNLDLKEFTDPYVKAFFEDLDFLGVKRANYYPRATEHIPEMVTIVQGLLDKGFAYKSDDGSIYFKISTFPAYGRLSGLKLDELKAGARVRQDDYDKDSAQDFALWKAWDENDGTIFWKATLGKGRPGWHIECSAMSMKYLGEHFDIHTGGVDNIFPHHENEIAQSEGFTGKKFANYWLESEHLLISDQKMAKRLGNFVTVRQLRERGVDGAALRYFLLSAQYRTQVNFTDQSLEQAAGTVRRINEFVSRLEEWLESNPSESNGENTTANDLVSKTRESYVTALDNDLDTPRALASVFELINQGNKILDAKQASGAAVRAMLDFMTKDFDPVFGVVSKVTTSEASLSEDIQKLLEERISARREKNWKLADSLREKLQSAGIEVQDTPEGQKWRKTMQSPKLS